MECETAIERKHPPHLDRKSIPTQTDGTATEASRPPRFTVPARALCSMTLNGRHRKLLKAAWAQWLSSAEAAGLSGSRCHINTPAQGPGCALRHVYMNSGSQLEVQWRILFLRDSQ